MVTRKHPHARDLLRRHRHWPPYTPLENIYNWLINNRETSNQWKVRFCQKGNYKASLRVHRKRYTVMPGV